MPHNCRIIFCKWTEIFGAHSPKSTASRIHEEMLIKMRDLGYEVVHVLALPPSNKNHPLSPGLEPFRVKY